MSDGFDLFAFWTPSDTLELPFRTLLGREPTPVEREAVEADGIIATAERIAGSTEHARRLQTADADHAYVLARSDAALQAHPVGTLSPCETGIVGAGGRLLLRGGSNTVLDQFLGRVEVSAGWLDDWGRRIDAARHGAAAAGARLIQLVVPEGLMVQRNLYPGLERRSGPPPIEYLLEAQPDLVYPIEAMRAAPGNARLATDSHCSPFATAAIFAVIMQRLGLEIRFPPLELREFMYLGDLGAKFRPRICEASLFPAPSAEIELLEDDFAEHWSNGRHSGTRRVVRNPAAPYDARVVVFGDSHSFPPPPGVSGSLGDLLSRTFAEVHHHWLPFAWDDGIIADQRPDIVIQEISESFLNPASLRGS